MSPQCADNGGANFARGGTIGNTPPSRSATVMVSETVYNTDGTVQKVISPRPRGDDFANAGIETGYRYDRAGRQTAVISNEQGGSLTSATRDNDVYTRTVYSPTSGLVSQRWRDVNGNGTQDTGDAVTTYSYGTTKGTLGPASLVATGHLVSAIERPLQTAGETAADRKTSLAYNALGEQVWSEDAMWTVRAWARGV
jgi:hypothetical protein